MTTSAISQATAVNHFNPAAPLFACPGCGFLFEYYFMRDKNYKVSLEQWAAAGLAHLLNERPPDV